MATPTLAPPVRRTGRTLLKVAGLLLAVAVLLVVGNIGRFFYAAYVALPQLDGRIGMPGISAPVTIARDAQGVPHIRAASLEDLLFAQGFATAQDRLWQMDISRRHAGGELSEVLGNAYLSHDRQQRILGLRLVAERAAAQLGARDRGYFEAYTRGVNTYINSRRNALPVEFRVLGYKPRPWTVADSFLVTSSMSQTLNFTNLEDMLSRERIAAKVGPELAADLYPNTSWRDHPPNSGVEEQAHPPGADFDNEDEEQPSPAPPSLRSGRILHWASAGDSGPDVDSALLVPGSNNWAVAGMHTVSGKPLLSNDMHLLHQIPGVWYEAHLTSGDFDVAGVTLPGVPFVIIGHNRHIAWGFTNVGPAVTDLFIETFNDRGEYQTPEGWRQPEHRREVIHVRDEDDVSMDVLTTRHGPIITETIPGETRKLALKWVLYDPAASQGFLFELNSARNWDEFRQALSRFRSPSQNAVYADMDGHIGYQVTGLIPQRASGNGSLPVPGNDNTHEWTGYIPFEQLPSVSDPSSGILATANGRITPDGYPYTISNEWGGPYRTERILRVLHSGGKFTPDDMLDLQMDVYSDFDRFCAERFSYAIDHAAKPSKRAREAADLMRNWDGRMTTDSLAAGLVVNSRRTLQKMLLEPKLGNLTGDYHWFMSEVWLENILFHQPASWLPSGYSNYDDLLTAAVEQTLKSGSTKLKDWRWGRQSHVQIQHPIFGRVPILRRWAGPGRHEQSGNDNTVKQVGTRFGPSARMTVDFVNLDNSTLNLVTGQSGNLFSPHYLDQWKAWYEGKTFPLPFSEEAVERAARHRLVLEPGK